jgi:FixJ family two-component response regulator
VASVLEAPLWATQAALSFCINLGGIMAADSIVYVIDGDSTMLRSIVGLLGSRGYHVAAFECPEAFHSSRKPNLPACLILDFNLGHAAGLGAQQFTGDRAMPVIFLSGAGDIPTAVSAMRSGAIDFLLKPVDEEQLLRAVRTALAQACERWIDCQTLSQIRNSYECLTPIQRKVLPYIVRGFLNKQTAYELGRSEITIRVHRAQIMRKMNASSLAELVRLAGCLGIPPHSTAQTQMLARSTPTGQVA